MIARLAWVALTLLSSGTETSRSLAALGMTSRRVEPVCRPERSEGPAPQEVRLEAPPELLADFFCQRREIGVLNIGSPGRVTVEGVEHALGKKDLVYVGRGSRDVSFASDDAGQPARFYLVSYPAHADHPTTCVLASEVQSGDMGSLEQSNRPRIARYIHTGGVRSAQLVMGMTALETGSVWNTMPAHTHYRQPVDMHTLR